MPRYILIDRHSGFIFGDTADYASNVPTGDIDPIYAARLLDESIGKHDGLVYREIERHSAHVIYDVFRADVDGAETIGIVWDGQDQSTIDAVERHCRYITSIARD